MDIIFFESQEENRSNELGILTYNKKRVEMTK